VAYAFGALAIAALLHERRAVGRGRTRRRPVPDDRVWFAVGQRGLPRRRPSPACAASSRDRRRDAGTWAVLPVRLRDAWPSWARVARHTDHEGAPASDWAQCLAGEPICRWWCWSIAAPPACGAVRARPRVGTLAVRSSSSASAERDAGQLNPVAGPRIF
jgi:hypothetical protein